jgi:hypothetical protein
MNNQNIETNVVKPELSFSHNDQEFLLLSTESEQLLDSKIQEIEDFMKNNDGKGKTDEEKDELYGKSQELWNELAETLRNTKYNFYLNRIQYNFLTNTLRKKVDYDVNTVFFGLDIVETLDRVNGSNYTNDIDFIPLPVDTTEVTYIYHLISEQKVKGINRDAYTFAEVLRIIGDISKIFNYYDTTAKNLATDIKDWVVLFDEEVTTDTDKKSKKVVSKKKTETETA